MTFTTVRFLEDIKDHRMEIIRDAGVYRHIRFKRPDTICRYFDLITWPGYLCYTGDMGTYVFTRLRDMFEFFRRTESQQPYRIDFRYWAEKCEASDRGDGIKKFSQDKFRRNVLEYVGNREEAARPDPEEEAEEFAKHAAAYAELRQAIEEEVLGCDGNGVRAFDAANDFIHEDGEAWEAYYGKGARFEFVDFWEWDHTEYTQRFLWCCHALVWGIQQYDQAKQPQQESL